MSGKPAVRAFFDEATNTFSYLVADPATKRAAVIDPVLDYDPKSGEVDIRSVEAVLAAAREAGYTIEWSLETHAHADHLSGSPYVKAKTGARIGIGENRRTKRNISSAAPHVVAGSIAVISAKCSSTKGRYRYLAGLREQNSQSERSRWKSGWVNNGIAEVLTRTKILLFHVLMGALIAPPLLAASALLITSMIGYNILQHPERHRSTGRMWNVIATDLYYLLEADLWQNKKECVQYDDKLLYKPSSGCRFSNKEFSTYLTFSESGRSTPSSRSPASGRPLIFAGDSDTMGWGVNDDETFTSIIASKVEVPVLNLGVSSYGTVREIMRLRMHPRFQEANCIFIQYSWNDFQENSVFLARGSLPAPTPERFQQLVFDYGRSRVQFLDVLRQTFDMMVDYPLAFFLNVVGLHEFPLGDDDPLESKGGIPREEAEDIKAFLAVLASFPELNDKNLFVVGPGRFVSALKRGSLPGNVFPIQVELAPADWFTLDMHPNKMGHREIATQILEQLAGTEHGRHCLADES